MRFSLITSTPNEMYAFNPFINTPAVTPLTMEAFIAPSNFDPDAQELNIVKAFAAYPDVNKKYIFSVGTSATTTPVYYPGRTYVYSENEGAYTAVSSGTITWTPGSTKRHVIMLDSGSGQSIDIPTSAVWIYLYDTYYVLGAYMNHSIKYIHCKSLALLINILTFHSCDALSGKLTMPNELLSFGDWCFQGCLFSGDIVIPNTISILPIGTFNGTYNITSMDLPSTIISLGQYCFYNNTSLTQFYCRASIPPSAQSYTFYNVNKSIPIHVPVGSLGAYQAAQYWNEFTNIIADL